LFTTDHSRELILTRARADLSTAGFEPPGREPMVPVRPHGHAPTDQSRGVRPAKGPQTARGQLADTSITAEATARGAAEHVLAFDTGNAAAVARATIQPIAGRVAAAVRHYPVFVAVHPISGKAQLSRAAPLHIPRDCARTALDCPDGGAP